MQRELPSSCSTLINCAKALLMRPVDYYTRDGALNTLVIYGAIKIIVLLGAIVISLRYQPSAVLEHPAFLTHWDGNWYRGIAYQGYAFNYPTSAAFPPLYPFLIKVASGNQQALMPWVEVLISNAFSFLGLYFLYKLVPLVVDERYRLRVCFAYMVFPVLTVCNLVSYSEPLFLAFTIGAYYFWKRSKFAPAALLAIFSVFTRQVGAFILIIFLVDLLYGFFSRREKQRALKQLGVIGATCAGVGMLYLFYYYTFGDPFIVARAYAGTWQTTFSVANLFQNVRIFGFGAVNVKGFNYSAVPFFLIDSLIVVATVLFLFKKDLALSAYSFVSLLTFLSLSAFPMSFVRYIAAIFPIYIFLGLMLSDDWKKNITVGMIAVVIAVQNLFIWISGEWLY